VGIQSPKIKLEKLAEISKTHRTPSATDRRTSTANRRQTTNQQTRHHSRQQSPHTTTLIFHLQTSMPTAAGHDKTPARTPWTNRNSKPTFRSLEGALDTDTEAQPGNPTSGESNRAGEASLEELKVMPEPDGDREPQVEWQDIETAADGVADTLAKELRLDQITDTRSGLSSGTTVNTKTAHRLGNNDPRVFTADLPGDDKEYFVVIVLDRSGSMSPDYGEDVGKIDVATQAVAHFALACESLDIDVAIIDFYEEEARYVKPPSVETEYAKDSILSTEAHLGTPLADALSLARSVADSTHKESIIISITDDKAGDVEATKTEIKKSYAPICSVTIATDCERGDAPSKAQELEPVYGQTTTVFDKHALDSRIDELASLLGVY